MKTYTLAIETPHVIRSFGPLMTLPQAEKQRDNLRNLTGKPVLVINVTAQ